MNAFFEELEKLDASETYPRRPNAREVLITQKDEECVFPVANGSAKLSRRDYEFQEPTLRRESTVGRENLSGESHGDREEFRPEETKDDEGINMDFWAHADARKAFWSTQRDFIYRHHIEPRLQLYVPREESFPIPLKYIDVIKSTHTDLDVAQENELMIWCVCAWFPHHSTRLLLHGQLLVHPGVDVLLLCHDFLRCHHHNVH